MPALLSVRMPEVLLKCRKRQPDSGAQQIAVGTPVTAFRRSFDMQQMEGRAQIAAPHRNMLTCSATSTRLMFPLPETQSSGLGGAVAAADSITTPVLEVLVADTEAGAWAEASDERAATSNMRCRASPWRR